MRRRTAGMNRVDLFPETAGDGPKLTLLHGFTQTLRSWDTVATELRRSYRVTSVDAPGHGLASGALPPVGGHRTSPLAQAFSAGGA